jgi:large subunit ribosomal protein L23
MARQILVKPIISEKAERLAEDRNQYSFIVDRKANKIEIRKAVEDMYSVNVTSVNTLIMPGKTKNRFTRGSVQKGRLLIRKQL